MYPNIGHGPLIATFLSPIHSRPLLSCTESPIVCQSSGWNWLPFQTVNDLLFFFRSFRPGHIRRIISVWSVPVNDPYRCSNNYGQGKCFPPPENFPPKLSTSLSLPVGFCTHQNALFSPLHHHPSMYTWEGCVGAASCPELTADMIVCPEFPLFPSHWSSTAAAPSSIFLFDERFLARPPLNHSLGV